MGNQVDIYSTRTMLQAINLMKPVYTFFRDTFFSRVQTFVTENVDVDFRKGKRKMAPFVAPRIGGVVMDRQGFETRTFKTPKVAPERVIGIDDVNKRAMGEAVYSTMTPEERAKVLLAQDIIELDDYITRREEWMCAKVLLEGKIEMKGEGFDQVVDYNFTNKEVLVSEAKWDVPATSHPLADLKRWRLSVIQKTGKAPTIAVFASDVADTFTAHPEVQAKFNLFHANYGNFQPSVQSPALTFIMKLNDPDLEIYSYDEWYIDDSDGKEYPMIPAGTVILGSKDMNQRIYGAITQVENGGFVTYEGMRIPKSWIDDEGEVRKLRIASRPLPAPDDVDAWYVGIVK